MTKSHTTQSPTSDTTNNKTAAMMSKAVFLLFLFSTRLDVGAADSPNLDDLMGGKKCPNYKCTGGLVVVPKSRAVKFDSFGCSGMGSMMSMGVDGDDGDDPKVPCCDQWHACYQVCGASKESCDTTFKTCAEDVCGADEKCKQSAKMKHMSIQFEGCQTYDQAQYKACECVPKNKAMVKRETVIRNFYKKHAPDSIDKAADLAKKADTAGKMASLLRKLIKKYPGSIQRKENPKMKEQEEFMRRARENVVVEEDQDSTEEKEEATEDEERIEL
jgi:hypothetical protein